MAAAGCPRVPLRCHPGLGRVPAGPRAAGSPAPDRRPPGAAHRTRRERAGGAVRAVRIRAGAAACAHPGQVRPAARPLRIPVPVLTGLEGHAGRTAEPTRARQRLVSDPGPLRPRCLAGTPSALPVPPLLATLRNKLSSGETRTLPPLCAPWRQGGSAVMAPAPHRTGHSCRAAIRDAVTAALDGGAARNRGARVRP